MQPPPPMESAVVVHGHKLVRECQEILKARRRRSKEELRDSSDERFFDFLGDDGRELRNLFDDKEYLVRWINGPKRSTTYWDSKDLMLSLDSARSVGLIKKREAPVFLPVFDWLVAYLDNHSRLSWKEVTPETLRTVGENRILEPVTLVSALAMTEEVHLGHTEPERGKRIANKIRNGMMGDKRLLPYGSLSVDVEKMRIHKNAKRDLEEFDILERTTNLPMRTYKKPKIPTDQDPDLCGPDGRDGDEDDEDEAQKAYGTDYPPMLACIMVGNGTSWNVVIRLPVFPLSEKGNWIHTKIVKKHLTEGDHEILKALEECDAAFGVGVKDDLELIRSTLYTLYKHPWKPPKALDISTMMYVAGYQYDRFNLATLAYLVLGVILNKRSSCADNRWVWKFSDLYSLQHGRGVVWYGLSDVLVGFNMAVVMFNVLFLEAYPDAATVRMALPTVTEEQWKRVFMLTLVRLVGDKTAREDTLAACRRSRRARIDAVMGYAPEAEMEDDDQMAAEFMHKLLGFKPHLVHGGPRFFEPIRQHFTCVQIPTLLEIFSQEISEGGWEIVINVDEVCSKEWIFKNTYGHALERVAQGGSFQTKLDVVQPSVSHVGLASHPLVKGVAALFSHYGDIVDMRTAQQEREYVIAQREYRGVPLRVGKAKYTTAMAIKEGCCNTPDAIPKLVGAMEADLRRAAETKGAWNPELTKHQELVKLHKIFTGRTIGTPLFTLLKLSKQTRNINQQKGAKTYDPEREGRIDALEAIKEGAGQVDQGLGAVRAAEVFKLMPATKENRLRNYLDKKRKQERKARKRAEREAALGVGSAGGTLSGHVARNHHAGPDPSGAKKGTSKDRRRGRSPRRSRDSAGGTLSGSVATSHSAVPDPGRIKRSTTRDRRRGRSPRRSSPYRSSRRHRSRSRRRRSSSRDLRRRLDSSNRLETRRSRSRRDSRGRSKDRRDLPSNDLRSKLESGGSKESPPEDLRARLNEAERMAAAVDYDWPEESEVMRVVPEERRIRDESRVSLGKKKRKKSKRAPNNGLNVQEGELF